MMLARYHMTLRKWMRCPICDTDLNMYCAIWGAVDAENLAKNQRYGFCCSVPGPNSLLTYVIFSVLSMAQQNCIFGEHGPTELHIFRGAESIVMKFNGNVRGEVRVNFLAFFCLETAHFHVRCPQIVRNCSCERSLELPFPSFP